MPRLLPSTGLVLTLLIGPTALAGLFGRKPPPPPPEEPDEQVVKPESKPTVGELFTQPLPLPQSDLPKGLANLTSQGCNACHYETTESWQRSAHRTGWQSDALVEAATDAGSPVCLSCHLPLAEQQVDLVVYDGGSSSAPRTSPNPAYDASLHTEGVTCAACHVRDGTVVAGRPPAKAAHPTGWSSELASSTTCAACHQLTWPGADRPFYDTFGEWQRSPQGKAGITCQQCHMRPGAESGMPSHDVALPASRAVSLLLDVDAEPMQRGQPGKPITITLQNTGAGHDFPTGSPYQGARLTVQLIGPKAKGEGTAPWGKAFEVDLERTVSDAPPWHTVKDTRLSAGAQLSWPWIPEAPVQAPAGAWFVRATIHKTVRGEVREPAVVVQQVPVRMR